MAMSQAAEDEARELTEHHLDEAIPVGVLDGARIAWPKDRQYWFIALILGLITAVEVTTYTHESTWGDFATPSLLFMMTVKFFMVTWFFMHLRYDSKILTALFYFGLVLATAVYVVALAAFQFFENV
jgi:caa(3)-type oxidase subunit IV